MIIIICFWNFRWICYPPPGEKCFKIKNILSCTTHFLPHPQVSYTIGNPMEKKISKSQRKYWPALPTPWPRLKLVQCPKISKNCYSLSIFVSSIYHWKSHAKEISKSLIRFGKPQLLPDLTKNWSQIL